MITINFHEYDDMEIVKHTVDISPEASFNQVFKAIYQACLAAGYDESMFEHMCNRFINEGVECFFDWNWEKN